MSYWRTRMRRYTPTAPPASCGIAWIDAGASEPVPRQNPFHLELLEIPVRARRIVDQHELARVADLDRDAVRGADPFGNDAHLLFDLGADLRPEAAHVAAEIGKPRRCSTVKAALRVGSCPGETARDGTGATWRARRLGSHRPSSWRLIPCCRGVVGRWMLLAVGGAMRSG